jgi:acetyl-CoA carboxylase biotin carboxyl carrier protein
MDQQQIKAFIAAMAASDLDEMEVSHEGWTLRLVRHARGSHGAEPAPGPAVTPSEPGRGATPAIATAAQAIGPSEVRAPMFGVVHLQQAPSDPPFVKAGDVVEAGQMLCTIEAMKVFNEVRAEQAGRIAAVLVPSGSEVEAGQPLLVIERVDHV